MCGGEKVEGGQGEEEVLEALGTLSKRASMGNRYVSEQRGFGCLADKMLSWGSA